MPETNEDIQAAPPVKEPVNTEPSKSKRDKSSRFSSLLSTLAILIAAPVVALSLTAFVFQSYVVDGQSMETTLANADRLIVWKAPRTWSRITGHAYIPHRGDIIIFVAHNLSSIENSMPGDKQLIKRVIGLPGDHVVVKDGKITIYNNANPNGFNPDATNSWGKVIQTTPGDVDTVVQAGQVFVCGDNRTNSRDSREFGAVSSHDIIGKMMIRVYPLNGPHIF